MKNNIQQKNKPQQKRYVDPMAVNLETTPITIWTLDPTNEGLDHINIHADSNHMLGRWFNPREIHTFPMSAHGQFNSIEAYVFYLLAISMSITDPTVSARVDSLRTASASVLSGAVSHLPMALRQIYSHMYRMPVEVYRKIIGYVADAYMSKLYVVMEERGYDNVCDTEIARLILDNRLPYFGYYVTGNREVVSITQRTTIISAISTVYARLLRMNAAVRREESRQKQSTMGAALLGAGVKIRAHSDEPKPAEKLDKATPDKEGCEFMDMPVSQEELESIRKLYEDELNEDALQESQDTVTYETGPNHTDENAVTPEK